jgi:hypothetical protein
MGGEFWLSEAQWGAIEPLLSKNQPGARRTDDRRVISGIVHVLKTGCRWQDCPSVYGPPLQSVSPLDNNARPVAAAADPRYEGRTMGVISLQGEAQAKLIEHKLLENLEPDVIEQRRRICGDAYAFQGDERHIVFLSMVAAPGEARIAALSNDAARQRFNVAARRAQDQLWLFHSATLDMLSPSVRAPSLIELHAQPYSPRMRGWKPRV